MVTKITKTKSKNLFGETPKQERRRLLKQNILALRKEFKKKKPGRVKKVLRSAGTTKAQRALRKKLLKRFK